MGCATHDVVRVQMLQRQNQLCREELRLWLCEQSHLSHPKEQRSAVDCEIATAQRGQSRNYRLRRPKLAQWRSYTRATQNRAIKLREAKERRQNGIRQRTEFHDKVQLLQDSHQNERNDYMGSPEQRQNALQSQRRLRSCGGCETPN